MDIETIADDIKDLLGQKEPEIFFPEGVPAFENAQSFNLWTNEEVEPFMALSSKEINGFGFFCVDPFLIYPDYKFKLSTQDQTFLEIKNQNEALVLAFVTRTENPEDFTANLMAPIVINISNWQAKQVIVDKYPVRYRIWDNIDHLEG
ncbi:MAG: flagellar assembly protein FliW [Lentisphaeria bacterium]|nr:flagellar assembly protein FliW [Lentisphaeria bacterium]NQZ70028.1 flagellar assembly protein FliW [Lentisphaeria bacterium]